MPLLHRLEISGFRCFDRLRVEGLTRVSLFVGKNNSGKTAVLEAAAILLNQETDVALAFASAQRKEIVHDGATHQAFADVRHLFAGHEPQPGSVFHIDGDWEQGHRSVSVTWTIAAELDLAEPSLRFPLRLGGAPKAQALYVERTGREAKVYSFTRNGGLILAPDASMAALRAPKDAPVISISGDPREARLEELWRSVIEAFEEQRVYDMLRLVEPELKQITIIGSDAGYVDLKGDKTKRLPLASMGDGFHQLLVLAAQFVQARGGTLLLDEFASGLHYTLLPRLFRLITEASRRLDVQVLATTHSKDCLEAVAGVYEGTPDLAQDISLHRVERGREAPARFDAARIAEYMEMELEAR